MNQLDVKAFSPPFLFQSYSGCSVLESKLICFLFKFKGIKQNRIEQNINKTTKQNKTV